MCMTLNGNQLNEIAKGLIITKPNILKHLKKIELIKTSSRKCLINYNK